MENMSDELINFTLSSLTPKECLKENSFGMIFILSMICFSVFVGMPAHLWCLWSYLHFDFRSKQSALFLLNLTIIEILLCMEYILETLFMFFFMNNKLLVVSAFLLGLCWTGRPLTHTCICVEQYLAVLHPVMFLRYKGIKYRMAAVVLVWVASFAYGMYEIMNMMFPDPVLNVFLLITLAVILFCCVSVLHALTQSGPGDITKQRGRDTGNQQKKNAFNMIISALLLICFTYFPYLILNICSSVITDSKMYKCNIFPFLNSFTICSVAISPILKIYNGI